MEKIKLRAPLALVLCAFSVTALFAEGADDGDAGKESQKQQSGQEQTGSRGGQENAAATTSTDTKKETSTGTVPTPTTTPADAKKDKSTGAATTSTATSSAAKKKQSTDSKQQTTSSSKKTTASSASELVTQADDKQDENTDESTGVDSNETIEDENSIDSQQSEITELNEEGLDSLEESEMKNITPNLPPLLFFGVPAGILLLLIIMVFIMGRVQLNTTRKEINEGFEQTLSDYKKLQQGLKELKEKQFVLEQKLNRPLEVRPAPQPSIAQDNSAQYKARIAELERDKRELENKNRSLQEEKDLSGGIASGTLDPVTEFNKWAATPQQKLPSAFYYIEGDMKIRAKHQLNESNNPDSKWITNREGRKKYLFPNPNSFTQMTASDLLYKITGMAKAKGQNRIRLNKACEMTNEGWVEFAGELEII